MNTRNARTLLCELPANFLCRQIDGEGIFATPSLAALFGAEDDSEFIQSLYFYDAATGVPLDDHEHPLISESASSLTGRHVRIKSNARSLNCHIEGRQLTIDGEHWWVIAVQSVHDNDVPVTQMQSSPLANHLAFNRLLSNLSSQLINVATHRLDSLIERSLGAFGEFCGVDRCYLFQFSDDKQAMDNTHEWVAPGVTPYKDDLQNVPMSDLPYFDKTIKSEQVFKVDDVQLLPKEAALEKAEFERERIRSVLCVAIYHNDELFGFVGCDILGSPYTWREHDIRYLKLIGEMLSNTLENVANRESLERISKALEEANRQLRTQASSDGLTGIANRRQFDDHLKKAIARNVRHHEEVSLLMVDVDFFKLFNDTYGHSAGDDALRQVAEALTRCCRRSDDLAARYGGEEFAIILPETDMIQAKQVAALVQDEIAALTIPFEQSPVGDVLTVSVGIATEVCCNDSRPSDLIERADRALYRAKHAGRNGIICDD